MVRFGGNQRNVSIVILLLMMMLLIKNIIRRTNMPEFIISTDKIISTIIDGNVDASLDGISAAIKSRRDAINSKKLFSIVPGDTVKINSLCRPRYLVGLQGEVTRVNQKTVSMRIREEDKFRARKYGYGEFRTPISLVDKV